MNALELIRVSTAGQAAEDKASIPAQRAINQRTAAAHGLIIVRSIEIADVSGAAVLLAPEMQEMIRLMNDPQIHGVVCRDFSRLMRPENFADYALLQVFADSNTVLYLPEGPIDFASKTGRLMGTIRGAIAGNPPSGRYYMSKCLLCKASLSLPNRKFGGVAVEKRKTSLLRALDGYVDASRCSGS